MSNMEQNIAGLQEAEAYFRSSFDTMRGTVMCEKFRKWTDVIEQVIALLKAQAQEPVAPIRCHAHAQGADDVWYECGKCGAFLCDNPCSKQFCAKCGKAVKWG